MKVGSRLLVDAPSVASQMALALEIPLPENALTRNRPALITVIERAAAGDGAAFEQLMIHSQHRVMALSWRILGNETDARDASQETFLRVYKYLHRFKPDQDFFAWIYRITVNVCRDILKARRQQPDQFRSLTAGEAVQILEIPAAEENAEQALIQVQRRELIARAIASLPFRERAAIVLREVEGFSTEEVAGILNSSATTVRSQISSARRKIRNYCGPHLRTE